MGGWRLPSIRTLYGLLPARGGLISILPKKKKGPILCLRKLLDFGSQERQDGERGGVGLPKRPSAGAHRGENRLVLRRSLEEIPRDLIQ